MHWQGIGILADSSQRNADHDAAFAEAIPPIAFFLCAKYFDGSDITISIPNDNLLWAYAILKPQKSLNIASTLPNCASI